MKRLEESFLKTSLKSKWILAVGATIFISYAIISVVLYIALQTWLLNNEEKNAMRTVDDMTSFFYAQERSVTIQNLQNNSALMKAILTQEQTVRIFNMDGIEVLSINDITSVADFPNNANINETNISEQTVDGKDSFVVHQLVQIGPFQGIMQLIHPLTTFHSMMKYILTTIIIVGIGALLFSVSISYYLANLLMKPLVQLRDAMNLVRNDGFKAQPEFQYKADDEIGDLLHMYRTLMNELEISFTKQQQFVADASHELRTPIQVIEGHLSLLSRWGKNDPQVLEESLHTSLAEITRMKKMIEELLQLARNEEADETKSADVEVVYNQVSKELKQLYPNANFELTVIGQIGNAVITEHALTQIFRNIMSNGIRYNINEPILQTTIQYTKSAIFVTIEDNGIGIAQEHLPHIFDRFYRIDASRTNAISGTGLGLSITKMLLEKYQGEINVESTLNNGTAFVIKLFKK
ncbi:HAMP domain-containing histidine kinase [Solibacillus sp. MA9]|uniref:histidine kinase n=1 Tax=Solibacillus palustris TaxID=2908203 RepID=A0ABS9UE79_9BACL|nr:HAMP domain-containing histidine kinase [Solibacillus sp. MA9]MCH7322626.1 HAMP domain-containing histidine kinase [Solibacillus sp. MA9]